MHPAKETAASPPSTAAVQSFDDCFGLAAPALKDTSSQVAVET